MKIEGIRFGGSKTALMETILRALRGTAAETAIPVIVDAFWTAIHDAGNGMSSCATAQNEVFFVQADISEKTFTLYRKVDLPEVG